MACNLNKSASVGDSRGQFLLSNRLNFHSIILQLCSQEQLSVLSIYRFFETLQEGLVIRECRESCSRLYFPNHISNRVLLIVTGPKLSTQIELLECELRNKPCNTVSPLLSILCFQFYATHLSQKVATSKMHTSENL